MLPAVQPLPYDLGRETSEARTASVPSEALQALGSLEIPVWPSPRQFVAEVVFFFFSQCPGKAAIGKTQLGIPAALKATSQWQGPVPRCPG